jgi:hypothetical protein
MRAWLDLRYPLSMSRLPDLLALHRDTPDDPDLHFMIATEHLSEGRPADAIPWLRTYVALGSDVGAGWALMADCHEALDQTDATREALRNGIDAALRSGHPTLAAELRGRIEEMEG